MKVARAMDDGKRGCSNVTQYEVLALIPAVNGFCDQVTFSSSEDGFDNAWNEAAKETKLQRLQTEFTGLLGRASFR